MMSSVQEIERAIDALSQQQIDELYRWLDQRQTQQVDAQIKADLDAGDFDALIDHAVADHEAGNTQLL